MSGSDKVSRSYTAPCPGCGAPVQFKSAQSTHAVCSYCHSTVVRGGDELARIGKISDEFADFSALCIGATGRWKGRAFAVVGRVQFGTLGNRWTEWHLAFSDGRLAILSEDNGSFVISEASGWPDEPEPASAWHLGGKLVLDGSTFTVTSVRSVGVLAAQGELCELPNNDQTFLVVELRSPDGRVCSIDYGHSEPTPWMGAAVDLDSLHLQGLRSTSEKRQSGRHLSCPKCGGRVHVRLDSSKSITCTSCGSLIDLSLGVGKELAEAQRHRKSVPLIPLGRVGQLQGTHWQVVGYVVREGKASGSDFRWKEYLLFHQRKGFAFLVDSEECWSVVKPVTGAPVLSANGQYVKYLGKSFEFKEAYSSKVSYVEGEFYWVLKSGESTLHRDYRYQSSILSMETTDHESVWSAGYPLPSSTIAQAFGLSLEDVSRACDSQTSAKNNVSTVLLVVLLLAVAFTLEQCSDDCDPYRENCSSTSYRSTGGSYGGSSSSGWHK